MEIKQVEFVEKKIVLGNRAMTSYFLFVHNIGSGKTNIKTKLESILTVFE